MRTTLYLPESLHQRLRMVGTLRKKSVSKLASDLLDKALTQEEESDLDRVYKGFEAMKGIAGKGSPNLSSSIDDILYGENGAWRGDQE